MDTLNLAFIHGFEWDEGNFEKSWLKHQVRHWECEQLFFNEPLLIVDDLKHSYKEQRYCALGKTDNDRQLFIAFTLRNSLIRVISAREMSKTEREVYEKVKENT